MSSANCINKRTTATALIQQKYMHITALQKKIQDKRILSQSPQQNTRRGEVLLQELTKEFQQGLNRIGELDDGLREKDAILIQLQQTIQLEEATIQQLSTDRILPEGHSAGASFLSGSRMAFLPPPLAESAQTASEKTVDLDPEWVNQFLEP